jgi:hypothetical protein
MDTFSKFIYVSEIKRQCHFALDAFEQLNETLTKRRHLQQRKRWEGSQTPIGQCFAPYIAC